MSKMKEEELLNRVTHWRKSLHKDYPSLQLDWTKKDEQAYQQIKEMIQKPEELPQKRALTVDEIISKYPESVRILLGELLLKIENLQKPELDKIFIGEKARELFGWSADPKTIKECEDFIRLLFEEVRK